MPSTTTRRVLDLRDVRHRKDPARREVRNVVLVDLRELGVAIAAGVAVVGGPIGLRCHQAIALAALAQQMNLLVVSAELEIERALVQDLAFERLARGELDVACERRRAARCATWAQVCEDALPGWSYLARASRRRAFRTAGRPTRRNAASSVALRAAICAWMLGPPSPPVASAPWHRAQRVSYSRRPGSDWAEARESAASRENEESRYAHLSHDISFELG